jgi:hypothetical protein
MKASLDPASLRAAMLALASDGFTVREVWLDEWFDGIQATKKVGDRCIQIFSGSENGDYRDPHYPPVVYLGEQRIAECSSVERARRLATIRASIVGAAFAKATGAAA